MLRPALRWRERSHSGTPRAGPRPNLAPPELRLPPAPETLDVHGKPGRVSGLIGQNGKTLHHALARVERFHVGSR